MPRGGARPGAGKRKHVPEISNEIRQLILEACRKRHPEFMTMDVKDLLNAAVKCLPKQVDADITLKADKATLSDLLQAYLSTK